MPSNRLNPIKPVTGSLKNLLAFDNPWRTRAEKLKGVSLRLKPWQLALELSRPWLLFALYLVLALNGIWLLAVPVAFGTCFAAFVQMHDCVHDALGLPTALNRVLLSLSASLILKSGHALKATHLKHHGKCLDDDDPEGISATWPLWKVLLLGPLHMLASRRESLRISPRTARRQLLETLLTVCLLALAGWVWFVHHSPVGLVYWAVVAILSATIPLWASYIPHRIAERNPALLITSHAAQAWTPMLTSFAYHQLHHRYPKVPTALLPGLAKALKAPQAEP